MTLTPDSTLSDSYIVTRGTAPTMISQELFDETLVENEEVFDLSPEDALKETVEQFEKSNQTVKHLSLTYPDSEEGEKERAERQHFTKALELLDTCVHEDGSVKIVDGTVEALMAVEKACSSSSPTFSALLDQHEGLYTLLSLLNVVPEESDLQDAAKVTALLSAVHCLLAILSKASNTQRDLTRAVLTKPLLQLEWSTAMQDDLRISILRLLYVCCKNNETNKKIWTNQKDSLRRLVSVLKKTDNEELALACCRFTTVLGRFDDFRQSYCGPPTISSSNDTVLELSRCGMVPVLKAWTDKEIPELMPSLLTSLRVMAVHDDIVQSMVAAGLLDTATRILAATTSGGQNLELVTATVGMMRNIAANDEIKTALCQSSVLPNVISIAETYPDKPLLQEHVCGLLGAMALRKPKNASRILQCDGGRIILLAMKRFATSTVVQRQGALAIRNLASRATPEEKQLILDTLNAEAVLQYAGLHGGSVDEAYAALRDLGCKVGKTTVHADGTVSTKPQMFGEVKSNFRAVYDE
jgi:hypothetical protein